MVQNSQRTETVDRLRAEIDSGKTGDKIPAVDPAAAPLGTDDEAGGHPPSSDAIAIARAQETGRGAHVSSRHDLGNAWVLIAAIVMLAAVMIAWGIAAK